MNSKESFLEKFARYEFKYLLRLERRRSIEEEVTHFMYFDGHAHAELDDAYWVRSLYFDNLWAANYYEKIDGMRTRRKFRVRTYTTKPDPEVPIYFEEKGRHNERTYKNRVAIDPETLPLFESPERHEELLFLYPDVPLIESFVYESIRKMLAPCVLVDYIRRPYMSEFDMNFRATFDSSVRATATYRLFPGAEQSWYGIEQGKTILEVKFNRRIPAWFHRGLQAHGMHRLSISKFCRGMEACGLAVNLE